MQYNRKGGASIKKRADEFHLLFIFYYLTVCFSFATEPVPYQIAPYLFVLK
jgi:hypothetical protein